MGRRRQSRTDLPQRMYCEGGVYYYWPKGGRKVWFRRVDRTPMGLAEALAEYGKRVERPALVLTVSDLIDAFERSTEFAVLAERTQADRRLHHAHLRHVFGHYDVPELGTADVLEWKRAFAAKAPRQWNQKLVALRRLMAYAIDPLGLIEARGNPTAGVKRMRESARTRAPSLDELARFAALCDPATRLYVALKLATGLRMGDLLRLDRRMILDDCLRTPVGKAGGKVWRFLFVDPATGESTGLREILDDILALRRRVGSTVLFPNRAGQTYTVDGWQSLWQRRMARWVEAGGERFHEHDIRASAGIRIEEAEGRERARQLLGHQTQRTTAIYTERADRVVVPIKLSK